jgi:endoglucanase
VNAAGRYVLSVDDGAAESHEFEIGLSPWGQVLAEIGRHYTLVRSGVAIDDPVTDIELEAGHPQDAEASTYWDDQFVGTGTIDVSGGWYDAGDYGKYVPPACVTVAQLMLAYEWNPSTFATGQFAFPPNVSEADREAGMPDLLAEVKYELEWLEKMQRPDGSVYHKVAGTEWAAMNTTRAEDDEDRVVFGLTTYGKAQFAGAMAMAARVYEDVAPDFADRMLGNARDAFQYLQRNREAAFRFDEGQDSGSGPYRKYTDDEDLF